MNFGTFFAPLQGAALDAVASVRELNPEMLVEDFPSGLWKAYGQLDPLAVTSIIVFVLFLYCWIMSILFSDYSYVDRQWSIVPTVYTAIFYSHPSTKTGASHQERLLIMTVLAALWSVRLSYNFWRRGGYTGMEDYRWPEIRARMHPVAFQLLNLFFIASYQHVLLLLLTLPAYFSRKAGAPLNNLDFAAAGLFLFFLILETTADQQQWNFQNGKYAARAAGKPLTGDNARGFRTTGLFRYSRHPNFFAEQSVWVSYYLFSVAATGQWLNCAGLGVSLLIMLFQLSTPFTEELTLRKYPLYRDYQKVTSRLLPLPARGTVREKLE